jgi:hypothetical protein
VQIVQRGEYQQDCRLCQALRILPRLAVRHDHAEIGRGRQVYPFNAGNRRNNATKPWRRCHDLARTAESRRRDQRIGCAMQCIGVRVTKHVMAESTERVRYLIQQTARAAHPADDRDLQSDVAGQFR